MVDKLRIRQLSLKGKDEDALVLIKEGAELGDAKCMTDLANAYCSGLGGVQMDLEKALHWYQRAAEQNFGEAFYGIASILMSKEDYKEALEYFIKGFYGGFAPAGRWVGQFYECGYGTEPDISKADEFYTAAAKKGNVKAERLHISVLLRGYKGMKGRIYGVLLFPVLVVKSFCIAFKDANSVRFL